MGGGRPPFGPTPGPRTPSVLGGTEGVLRPPGGTTPGPEDQGPPVLGPVGGAHRPPWPQDPLGPRARGGTYGGWPNPGVNGRGQALGPLHTSFTPGTVGGAPLRAQGPGALGPPGRGPGRRYPHRPPWPQDRPGGPRAPGPWARRGVRRGGGLLNCSYSQKQGRGRWYVVATFQIGIQVWSISTKCWFLIKIGRNLEICEESKWRIAGKGPEVVKIRSKDNEVKLRSLIF